MNCGINRILSYVSCYSAVINNEKEAENNGRVIAESGAIIDYILRRHGNGRLQPDPASAAYDDYVHWLHYTEGPPCQP